MEWLNDASALSLICSWDDCQKLSPLQISDKLQAGFKYR